MFARPPKEDVWYLAAATLRDGREVDLLTGSTPDPGKPESTSEHLPNQNWRHFLWRLNAPEYQAFRRPAADFLCRSWNGRHGHRGRTTEMHLVSYGERPDPAGVLPAFPYVRWVAPSTCSAGG
jgi:hypothetical protein